MPFAYVVNKNTSAGTLTDAAGNFSVKARAGDTLHFSYLGYGLTRVCTHEWEDSVKNAVLTLKVFLKPKSTELKPVIIHSNAITKEEKQLYEGRINEYKRGISAPLASPISAMYYSWSKKGKELKKLSVLYDQLLLEEVKQHRLSPEKVRLITGNDTLDVNDFMLHCYLPDQFVSSAPDYDLFLAVKNCYREYMISRRKN